MFSKTNCTIQDSSRICGKLAEEIFSESLMMYFQIAKIINQSITQSLFFLEAFSIVSPKAYKNKAEITSCMIFNPQKLCAISPYLQGWTEAILLLITQTSHNAGNAIKVFVVGQFCCLFTSNFQHFLT